MRTEVRIVLGLLAVACLSTSILGLLTSADAQTHTMPGSNVVPSGASLTVSSGGTITAAAGSTVTGFGSPLQWDGGATNLVAATGRTSLGGTTVGQSFFTLANPGAVTFPEISAGNVVSAVSAATMRTDLGVQAADSDLTTWAGITPVAAVGTWIATPSSANLRLAMTDENGTGALLFSGATTPDFTTGFTIGAAAASGKIPIGNGTNYVPSTPTWPTAAGTAGYTMRSDGTNFASYPQDMLNASTASVTSSYNADTYLVGSSVVVAAGDIKLKGQYHCVFDMAKAGAGTGVVVITVRAGTLGTTGDTAIMTFTFGAGTGVADLGVFDVWVNIRTTGASATSTGTCLARHNLATTGIFSNAAVFTVTGAANATFNQTTATTIGLSFTGGATFTGTNTLVQATLVQ